MYKLYVDDKLSMTSDNLEVIKNMGFVLATRGHKVAYIWVPVLNRYL